ncbi:hypothetical protein BZA77DRAFT_315148 [Pyronema omphalodes]|nr:hypothetical protein BZA77DRAFT_315148 [Pyronema omphalodes]
MLSNFLTVPTNPAAPSALPAPPAPRPPVFPKPKSKAKANLKSNKSKAGGRKAGAQNFSHEDREYVIMLLEEIRPVGPELWQVVASRYTDEYSRPNHRTTRDRDGLRSQFYKLYKIKIPADDPNFPDYVLRAKNLKRKLDEEALNMMDINYDDSEAAASDVEADRGLEVEAETNNVDIQDNAETNPTVNNNDHNFQPYNNDYGYGGTDPTAAIAIENDTASPSIPRVPSSSTPQTRRSHPRPSRTTKDDFMTTILKSFDAEAQATRNERLSIERLMRTQVSDYKRRANRLENELKDAREMTAKLQRKVSRLQMAEMVAEMMDGRRRGKKRKASAMVLNSDDEHNEDSDDEDRNKI